MDQQSDLGDRIVARATGIARLSIGIAQGIIAWALLRLVPPVTYGGRGALDHAQAPGWPQNHPMLFGALALLTAFLPVIALAEMSRMKRRNLSIYLATAAFVLAALVAYDIWRQPMEANWASNSLRIWPSAGLVICAGLGTFIVNQLLEHRESGHRLFADYAAHFEDCWMRGFQFVISLFFTLLVWGVLVLGKALFDLIHLEWFGHMIERDWFRCPVLAFAFAASVQISDVRPTLLRGTRNLGLTLLSWLLPLVVVLGCAFLAALLFTGLEPLWGTRFAASILLWSVTVTLVLLNAAYKDGDPAHVPGLPVRWAARVAGPMMLVLTVLAIDAIVQRIWQHGWTPQRVQAVAVASVALIYSAGYSWASTSRGPWLNRLEKVNVVASIVILAVLFMLLTPVADPARLAVNSQVGRLQAGAVAPARFDYQFLHFDAGRYGTNALSKLTQSANADIASRAKLAQAASGKSFRSGSEPDPAATEPALSHAAVYPKGAKLPADFIKENIDTGAVYAADCLKDGSACDIIVWKRPRSDAPLLIVRERPGDTRAAPPVAEANYSRSLSVLARNSKGRWEVAGQIDHVGCPGVLDALKRGEGKAIVPDHDDLQVGGVRLTFSPTVNPGNACPVREPAPSPSAPARDPAAPAHMGPAFGNPGAL